MRFPPVLSVSVKCIHTGAEKEQGRKGKFESERDRNV